IGRGRRITVTDALERKLYIIRKSAGHAIQALHLEHGKEFYVPTMSARTICYKGMLLANQVGEYYLDLTDARVESALALVHQRFSTNTFPSWDLAHPFRMICHNGEINTLRGNVNWIRARQGAISSPILGDDLHKIWPLIYAGQSDSASFDNALELLVMGGYSVAHAMMMMIPEAWENHTLMDPARRAFYEYHAAMMEPWDGPASIAFTDGRQIGAMGNDSPLAVLSSKDKTLYHYFKQLFAQVTNPAIDPIREELVMSLVSFIGPKPNLLGIDELNPPLRLEVSQPVLDFYEME